MAAGTPRKVGSIPGFIREGTVKSYNATTGKAKIVLNLADNQASNNEFDAPIHSSWAGQNGEFSGGYPEVGASVWAVQGQGGRWVILGYAPAVDTVRAGNIPVKSGQWVTRAKNGVKLSVEPQGVIAGTAAQNLHINPATPDSPSSIISYKFDQALAFTEASRRIDGPVKRDVSSNSTRNISSSALSGHQYDASLKTIGLDPIAEPGTGHYKNPAFSEVRETVYEFVDSYKYSNDATEAERYNNENTTVIAPSTFQRKSSRADAISLSLNEPNHLIETIKGTAVDIFGNLLDLNRNKLPSGSVDALSFRANTENKEETFIRLREQARKTIAYHFEINARKAKVPDRTSILVPTDYGRDRSRFFFDVDKEGQFKLNVPASSEVGNIGLLTRYENSSTLLAMQNDGDPGAFIREKNNTDIFLDSHADGYIALKGSESALETISIPNDRITDAPIKLGTAYHDISKTSEYHNFTTPVLYNLNNKLNLQDQVPLLGPVVTDSIIVSGENANAGGRSGTINLDGHLSFNIGANTIDRQSLWLDLAGGIVSNIGRDRLGRSYIGKMDGGMFLEIGGFAPTDDSRFTDNGYQDGILDIRVMVNNQVMVMRFDKLGLKMSIPGDIDIESSGNMRLKSKASMILDAKDVYIYEEDTTPRLVTRRPGRTIG